MLTRTLQFLAIILIALYLVPLGAHLIEYPAKMALDQDDYFTVQQIYRGWSLSGVLIIAALLVTAVLTAASRSQRPAMLWAGASFLLLLVSFIEFFARVMPMNKVTENWTTLPDNWEAVRAQWETGHVWGALIVLLAFIASVLSALAWHPPHAVQTVHRQTV